MRQLLFTALFLFSGSVLSGSTLVSKIGSYCSDCPSKMETQTASFILEYGEEALMSRGWLVKNATKSIDLQYFIWSTDNIGILASEALLAAAERGVKIRVLVDDLLIDAEDKTLVALAAHPNVEIKVYNPNHSVGTSKLKKIFNVPTNFRGVNQRMHDKTAIFDGIVSITGGRNMADEYFDYNQIYNFRDRDILLIGKAVSAMTENFDEFWASDLSVPVDELLKTTSKKISDYEIKAIQAKLHAYADNEDNFEPEVKLALDNYSNYFPALVDDLVWGDVEFISDKPGKNDNKILLSGGGETTEFLADKLKSAQESILIQSPYLVMSDGLIELFESLTQQGVSIKISTNSLASTDNLMAFSGYQKKRKKILKAGIEVYEYKPYPEIQEYLVKRYPRLEENLPIFAIHAKSMVIDDKQVYIGTFNLDPRSANLNTEVGVYIEDAELARQLTQSINRDINPDNSWRATLEFNPDKEVGVGKRFKTRMYRLVPMEKLL